MKPPDFLMVKPSDIGRVGVLGAAILALVRYATGLPGETNDRKKVDGEMWWRASHDDIGQSLGGVHRDSIRRALAKLQGEGALLARTPVDTFYGDRAKAYRVPDVPLRGMQQGSDLPLRENAESITRNATSSCGETQQAAAAKAPNLPITGELKEHSVGENGAAPAECEPLDVEVVDPVDDQTRDSAGPENLPARRNGHSPPSANGKPKPDPRGTRLSNDWMPDRAVIDQMRGKYPSVDLRAEHDKFVDYWAGAPGAKGRKVDWNATWRNWIRRAAERAAPARRSSSVEDNVAGWLEGARRVEDDERQLW